MFENFYHPHYRMEEQLLQPPELDNPFSRETDWLLSMIYEEILNNIENHANPIYELNYSQTPKLIEGLDQLFDSKVWDSLYIRVDHDSGAQRLTFHVGPKSGKLWNYLQMWQTYYEACPKEI